MDRPSIGLVVGYLSDWPDGDLERAYRLISATIANRLRSGSFGDDPDDVDLAAEAEQLGLHLVSRGLL